MRILGFVTGLIGVTMIPAVFISLFYGEKKTALCFLAVIVPVLAIGFIAGRGTQRMHMNLKLRECFLVVTLSWTIASLIGAFPYILTGTLSSFADAFFESTSGFTTTGATIITNVEILPKGLLFWRSFSQWLGGMGILVFAVSLLPALGISGQLIAKIETPGPSLHKISPRITDSSRVLYLIYITFTVLATVLLYFGGMAPFDALLTSFGSVSAGGFSIYNDGAAHFSNSAFIDAVISFFTLAVCINFTLYYSLLRKNWKDFWGDAELRAYGLILGAAILLVSGNLWFSGLYLSPLSCLRYGFFQVTSFLTTTGYSNTDLTQWPSFSKMILFFVMIIGACSASAGGGIKVMRILVLYKQIHRSFHKKIHPRAVLPIKLQGKPISAENTTGALSFLYLYVFIFVLSALILSLENLDLAATFNAVASIMSNVGGGFKLSGPVEQFQVFSAPTKIYLCFLMMMGRLEFFTILSLFTPAFWNPDR